MPGIVELHCHIAGAMGLNDTVYLTNPGLRASSDVIAGNATLRRGLASGVTTVLYIPGSGANIGGQGILLRSGFDTYERAEIRNPGSMKLAQAGNPHARQDLRGEVDRVRGERRRAPQGRPAVRDLPRAHGR